MLMENLPLRFGGYAWFVQNGDVDGDLSHVVQQG
jgi:hypothetical protein